MAEKAEGQNVAHFERDGGSEVDVKDTQEWNDAKAGNENEHALSIREALKQYRWAVMWSLLVSMSIIMEGYDTNLIGNASSPRSEKQELYAYPEFKRAFGEEHSDGEYVLTGPWQSGLGAAGMAGSFFGALLNGFMIKRIGFRWSMIVGMIMMIAFPFLSVFGETVEIQTVGQALCGLPWGIFATIGPAYASEILPLALRPYLTAYTNMCFAIGQFISAGVLQGTLSRSDAWGYKIPFALQWLWPPFLLVAAYFMPESPWWLVRHGRHDEAEAVVCRISSGDQKEKARQSVAMMHHTNELEMEVEAGTSYWHCWKGTNARRTEIACMVFAGQVLSGSEFAYSGTFFFEQAGLSSEMTYNLNLGGTAIAFAGTIISWFLMKLVRRRTLYLSGLAATSVMLLLIGCLEYSSADSAPYVQSAFTIIWLFFFSLSIGPGGWCIPAEVSSTRLRSKTIVLARNTYYICNAIARVVEPILINPGELNLKGKTGFFWFAFCMATLIWGWFRLTETKNRTFQELDIMFEARLPTRKFKTYVVDPYAEHTHTGDPAVVELEKQA